MNQRNIGLVIQARTGSSRFPMKIVRPIDGSKTFLDVLLSRLNVLRNEVPLIVATTHRTEDNCIAKIAESIQIPVFRGSEHDVLDRFIQCAKTFRLDTIIRVCSDNPFIDLEIIRELLQEYDGEDYLSHSIGDVPAITTHYGFFAEIVAVKALQELKLLKNPDCMEHVTNCIYRNTPNKFNVRFIPLPNLNPNIRCTLDTEGDFQTLKRIYFEWDSQLICKKKDYLSMIRFIESKPQLLDQMKYQININTK